MCRSSPSMCSVFLMSDLGLMAHARPLHRSIVRKWAGMSLPSTPARRNSDRRQRRRRIHLGVVRPPDEEQRKGDQRRSERRVRIS